MYRLTSSLSQSSAFKTLRLVQKTSQFLPFLRIKLLLKRFSLIHMTILNSPAVHFSSSFPSELRWKPKVFGAKGMKNLHCRLLVLEMNSHGRSAAQTTSPPLSSNQATSDLISITKEPSSGWQKVPTIFGITGRAILLTGVIRAYTRKQILKCVS